MTQAEKEQLHAIIDELKDIQSVAPSKATYSRGRTDAGISYRLLDVLSDLIEVSDYATETTEPATT